jgi:hypothetical protein
LSKRILSSEFDSDIAGVVQREWRIYFEKVEILEHPNVMFPELENVELLLFGAPVSANSLEYSRTIVEGMRHYVYIGMLGRDNLSLKIGILTVFHDYFLSRLVPSFAMFADSHIYMSESIWLGLIISEPISLFKRASLPKTSATFPQELFSGMLLIGAPMFAHSPYAGQKTIFHFPGVVGISRQLLLQCDVLKMSLYDNQNWASCEETLQLAENPGTKDRMLCPWADGFASIRDINVAKSSRKASGRLYCSKSCKLIQIGNEATPDRPPGAYS